MKKLRVAILMRGSTNKQTSAGKIKKNAKSARKTAREINIEDDLPTQKNAILEFINSQPEKHLGIEWEFSGLEFVEAGVSAFHTHTSKRKGLIEAKAAAQNDLYDILVIFKLDRFGRRSSESLTAAMAFLKYARIWVVDKKAEFKSNGTQDEIMNFVEFWAAKKASEDTKVRVEAAMKQIHQEGFWTGGNPPFGFENHPETANMLKVIPEEAAIVKEIYDLYVNHGYGCLKVAGALNEKGILSRTGRNWSSHTVRKILMNTVYKGHLSYGKTKVVEGEFGSYQKTLTNGEGTVSERYWKEYDIVGKEIWEKAQEIRTKRVKPNLFGGKTPSKKATGKGLLVSVLKCECGGFMTYCSSADWADNKRTKKKAPYGIYRCMTRIKQGVKACGAEKGSYRVLEIEEKVIDQLTIMTTQMIKENTIERIREKTLAATGDLKEKITNVKEEMERYKKAQNNAKEKITKIILGEIEGNENLYNEVYTNAETKLKELEKQLKEFEALKSTDDLNDIDIIKLEEFILNWRKIFDYGTPQQKRNLIQALVSEIKISKEKITITTAFDIPKFFESITAIKQTAATLENKEITADAPSLHYVSGRGAHSTQKTGMLNKTMLKKLSKVFTYPIEDHFQIEQHL